jgi:very-short-patch-repair endonuclease
MTAARARTLRKTMPPAEARMWNMLRMGPLKDLHFRRQVPFGPYYADFASHAARLALEIDGATHSTDTELAHDATLTAFIEAQGYRVLRFTNGEVTNQLDGVFAVIADAVAPTLAALRDLRSQAAPPSPRGGGRTSAPDHRGAAPSAISPATFHRADN